MSDHSPESSAVIALLRLYRQWSRLSLDVLECGSALTLLQERTASPDSLFPIDNWRGLLEQAKVHIAAWRSQGVDIHTVVDDNYPAQLRDIRELPPVLFTRGTLADDFRAIAVVGTRSPSERSLAITQSIVARLVHRRITVVSGLAAGIDAAAHTAALAAGGRTVAVIGTGINRCYPARNRALQERIAAEGLLVSQFWPDATPRKHQFLMRNEVMSGYAAATLVVEAGEQSGTRHQAFRAMEHGRQVILLEGVLSNDWARTLSGQPGVYVANNIDDLMAIVDNIVDPPTVNPREVLADLAI